MSAVYRLSPSGREGMFAEDSRGVYCTVGGGSYVRHLSGVMSAYAHQQNTTGLLRLVRWLDCACTFCEVSS